MPGVLFRVYDADGAVVADGYTDASGVFTTGKLPLGEYSIKEILGLQGYRLDETAYPVSLVKRQETVTVTVKNDPRKAALHIFKRDAVSSQEQLTVASIDPVEFVVDGDGDAADGDSKNTKSFLYSGR